MKLMISGWMWDVVFGDVGVYKTDSDSENM